MKKSLWYLVFPLVIAFSSCEKETPAGTFKAFAKADIVTTTGTRAFSAVNVNAISSETALVKLTVTFDGPSGGEYIVLGIKGWDKNSATGTFTIGTTSASTAIAAYHKPNSNADEIATSGQIVIDKFAADIISGTFYFNTPPASGNSSPATQVKNGEFEASVKF